MRKLRADEETVPVGVRMTESEKRQLERYARTQATTVSALLRDGVFGDCKQRLLDVSNQLDEARAAIVLAQYALGSDHPVFWILDDLAVDELRGRLAPKELWEENAALRADNKALRRLFAEQKERNAGEQKQ